MIAKELISYHIPSASCSATGDDVLVLMDENQCTHIALVDKGTYHGIISDSEIYDLDDSSVPLKQVKPNLLRPFIDVYSHIYEAISIVNEYQISIIPVLDEKEKFIGVISLQDLALKFSKITNAHEPGGILILEVNIRDYSLAQAAQIVESDNAKILSSYICNTPDSLKIDLVLKINKKDLSAIISAFSRYNYIVKASYHESKFDDDIQRRYEQFMNYLKM